MKYLVPAYLSKNTWNNISVVANSPIKIGSGANNSGDVKIRVLDKNFDLVDGGLTLSPGAATVIQLPIEPGEIAIIQGQAVDKKWNYYITIETGDEDGSADADNNFPLGSGNGQGDDDGLAPVGIKPHN